MCTVYMYRLCFGVDNSIPLAPVWLGYLSLSALIFFLCVTVLTTCILHTHMNMYYHHLQCSVHVPTGSTGTQARLTPPYTIINVYRWRSGGKHNYVDVRIHLLQYVYTDIHVLVSNDTLPTTEGTIHLFWCIGVFFYY